MCNCTMCCYSTIIKIHLIIQCLLYNLSHKSLNNWYLKVIHSDSYVRGMAASYLRYFFLHTLFDFWNFLNFTFKHQNTRPPWGRSEEHLLCPITQQVILFPLLKNNEHDWDIFHGKWPIIVLSFITATAYLSLSFPVSLWHGSSSPITASQMLMQMWLNMHATVSFTPGVGFHSFSVGWARDQSLDEAQHFINPIRFLAVPVQSIYQ